MSDWCEEPKSRYHTSIGAFGQIWPSVGFVPSKLFKTYDDAVKHLAEEYDPKGKPGQKRSDLGFIVRELEVRTYE